jgi:hypothetical protein
MIERRMIVAAALKSGCDTARFTPHTWDYSNDGASSMIAG